MTTPTACPHCGQPLAAKPPTVWTAEKEDELRRYWADDVPKPEMGRRLQCSATTVARKARELGLPHRQHIVGATAASWTDDKVKILTDMWANNRTAAQIGSAIGISRNAVIGKVTRLGLAGRKSGPPKGQMPPNRITKKKAATPSSPAARVFRAPAMPRLSKVEAPPIAPVDNGQIGVLLLDLDRGRCKWPISTSEDGLVLCGRKAQKRANGQSGEGDHRPYCKCHCGMAYVPLRSRERPPPAAAA